MNQAFHVIQHLIGLGFILVHEREAKAKGDQAIDPELFFAFLSLLFFFLVNIWCLYLHIHYLI